MKTHYLVCYDIAAPERWQGVHKIMQGAGTRLQYSVCDLSDRERERPSLAKRPLTPRRARLLTPRSFPGCEFGAPLRGH